MPCLHCRSPRGTKRCRAALDLDGSETRPYTVSANPVSTYQPSMFTRFTACADRPANPALAAAT